MGRNQESLNSNAPPVYEEGDIIKRTLRDTYDNDIKMFMNDYQKAKFMKELIKCILRIGGKIPLFHERILRRN